MFTPIVRCQSRQIRILSSRALSSSGNVASKKKLELHSGPPSDTTHDWIGPADSDSNLRPIKHNIPEKESRLEKEFRQLVDQTQKWNQEYWASHNKNFFQEKNAYIKQRLEELGPYNEDGTQRRLTAEDLSVFYARFLNENYEMHKDYNKQWYKRNIYLLWPALKVNLQRLVNRR